MTTSPFTHNDRNVYILGAGFSADGPSRVACHSEPILALPLLDIPRLEPRSYQFTTNQQDDPCGLILCNLPWSSSDRYVVAR